MEANAAAPHKHKSILVFYLDCRSSTGGRVDGSPRKTTKLPQKLVARTDNVLLQGVQALLAVE